MTYANLNRRKTYELTTPSPKFESSKVNMSLNQPIWAPTYVGFFNVG